MPRNYCGRVDCGCNDIEAETCPHVVDWSEAERVVQALAKHASSPTLGGGRSHVYVTRAAVLDAWKLLPAQQGFEEVRRELSHLLLDALPVPGDRRRWTFDAYGKTYVAYVVPDGDLLIVGNVALAQGAPEVYGSSPPVTDLYSG